MRMPKFGLYQILEKVDRGEGNAREVHRNAGSSTVTPGDSPQPKHLHRDSR